MAKIESYCGYRFSLLSANFIIVYDETRDVTERSKKQLFFDSAVCMAQ